MNMTHEGYSCLHRCLVQVPYLTRFLHGHNGGKNLLVYHALPLALQVSWDQRA